MAKFELEEYHRNISKEELIKDLKSVATKLKKNSVTTEEYKKYGKFHPCTLHRKFSSWLSALKEAGLQKTRNYKICDEELFKNLEEIWVKLGRQPHHSDIQKALSKYSSNAYMRRFGTWRKALKAFVEYVNKEEVSSLGVQTVASSKDDLTQEITKKHKTKRDISWRLRFIVMRRDNFKCKNCGRSPATDPKIILHVDHITPYANGGETAFDNLQTLCSICNIGKGNL